MRCLFFTAILVLLHLTPTDHWFGAPIHSQSLTSAQGPSRWESINLPFRPTYVTSVENVFWVCGADEMLAESEDEGRTWQLTHQKTDGEVLLHVGFLNKVTGYATGTNGILLWTRDSGKRGRRMGLAPLQCVTSTSLINNMVCGKRFRVWI